MGAPGQPAGELAPFTERYAAEVLAVTEDYVRTGAAHPYLHSLTSGGIVQANAHFNGGRSQEVTVVEAAAIRGDLGPMPEDLVVSGVPERVALRGILWSVHSARYQMSFGDSPRQMDGPNSRVLCYWDDSSQLWEAFLQQIGNADDTDQRQRWNRTNLSAFEHQALSTTARQIATVFRAHDIFGGEMGKLARLTRLTAADPDEERLLAIGLDSPRAANNHTEPGKPRLAVEPWMSYYSTGYQSLATMDREAEIALHDAQHGDRVNAAGLLARAFNSPPFTDDPLRLAGSLGSETDFPVPLPTDLSLATTVERT